MYNLFFSLPVGSLILSDVEDDEVYATLSKLRTQIEDEGEEGISLQPPRFLRILTSALAISPFLCIPTEDLCPLLIEIEEDGDIRIKLVAVGDGAVGKTSLLIAVRFFVLFSPPSFVVSCLVRKGLVPRHLCAHCIRELYGSDGEQWQESAPSLVGYCWTRGLWYIISSSHGLGSPPHA